MENLGVPFILPPGPECVMLPPDAGSAISVIIPSWNGGHLLPSCLTALTEQTCTPGQVIVVDDGSTDNTAELLRSDYPWVLPLVLPENRGFARAVNAGIYGARGDIVVLLNNDAEPEPEWLARLCAPLASGRDLQIASCASKISLTDHPGILHSAGDSYQRDGVPSNRGVWARDNGQFDRQESVFGACAAAAAYRRDVVLAAGGFDEWLGMYCEDVDLAWRLQLQGYRCLFVPEARVSHRLSETGGGPLASYFCGRNFLLVAAMNLPGPLLYRHWWRIVSAQLMISLEAMWHSREPAARARLRGQLAGLSEISRAWRRREQRQKMRCVPVRDLDAILS